MFFALLHFARAWRTSASLCAAFLSCAASGSWTLLAAEPNAATSAGGNIYHEKCASCHGPKGEGTPEEYPQSLAGDWSVPELAKYIDKEMPKGEPEECVGDDARQVAAYIHDAFYSLESQLRINPPRIELARLTVRQHRNAVADLVGSFRSPVKREAGRGLKAEYFKSRNMRNMRNGERIIERVDPTVRFDFGAGSPQAGKIDEKEFAIRWQGSVVAPETGEYEFIIRTENAGRLWINDNNRALIDAWVKSGADTEHRATIWLLGGRAYSLRLEFQKTKEKSSSVALLWKQPRRVPEVIPERCLLPQRVSEVYVAQTPFPPDDRSMGYERGTAVSREWDQAATNAALETAGYVAARIGELAGVGDGASDRAARVREFCFKFVERAFRRPLSPEQRRFFVEQRFEKTSDVSQAVKQVVLLTLKSPRFLYREVGSAAASDYDVAARLSFGLWDSLPDEKLLAAAAAGQLKTREQVAAQAERMQSDERARAKLRTFLWQWLRLEQHPDVVKDAARFPGFNAAVAADLRTSLEMHLDEVLDSAGADYRQLLLADEVYLNGRLANFFGADLPADAEFQKYPLDPGERAGVLTHPYLMTVFAYREASSPIHRGVFVTRGVLGRVLRAPPVAIAPLEIELHADLTTRQRVELQTNAKLCQTCHATLNRLGFALEPFDAVGRFRTQDNARPVDAAGQYQTRQGELVKFNGARELAGFLAHSRETHHAFVDQLFHASLNQPLLAYGSPQRAALRQAFIDHNFNIRQLMVDMVVLSALGPPADQPKTGS